MMAAGGNHQQHVPPLQLNGVPSRLRPIPQGCPRLHRHVVVLGQVEEATSGTPKCPCCRGGQHLGVGGDIGVGELGPTPHTRHDDAVGWSVLGRGAEPLVRTQFPEHPPSLNFGANHLKKWIQHPQKPPIPFLSPHNPHHGGGFCGGGGAKS